MHPSGLEHHLQRHGVLIQVANLVQVAAIDLLVAAALHHPVAEEAILPAKKIAEIATTTEEIVTERDLEAQMTVTETLIGIATEIEMMIVIGTETEK